jgi:hypothetical protein
MPSPNILAALGAALQGGQQTFTRISEQEREKKLIDQARMDRIAEQRQAALRAERDDKRQDAMLAGQQQDREQRNLMNAIEGVQGGGSVSRSLFDRAEKGGLQDMFTVKDAGSMFATPSVGMGMGGFGQTLGSQITKNTTLKEDQEATDRNIVTQEMDRKNTFRTHVGSKEHAGETFDQQVAESMSNGMGTPPLSSSEFDRREGVQNRNRLGEIAEQNKGRAGNMSNTSALVQAVLADPSVYAQMSKPLQAKLSPALAEAGFDFKVHTPPNAYNVERMTRVVQDVDLIRGKVSNWSVGPGSVLSGIPATDAKNFAAELETLKANIAFNELAEMRAASKTGGALGQVSDKEGSLLQSTLGALDQAQGKEQFLQQLDKVKASVARWNEAKAAAAGQFVPPPGSGTPNGGPPLQVTNPGAPPPPAAGPKVGERRTINGTPAAWDGKGWRPISAGPR